MTETETQTPAAEALAQEDKEKCINESYKIWKKNSPFLYDLIVSHALEWPTLTLQWFPDAEANGQYTNLRMLLGTHTSGSDPNYLMIGSVQIPNPSLNRSLDNNANNAPKSNLELGGYSSNDAPKFTIVQRIDHDGEVNRAKYMPQNPDIIATMSPSSNAYIFDRKKHSLTPKGTFSPQMKLVGHSDEGFALSWNPNKEGLLATGAADNKICVWDIEGSYTRAGSQEIKPAHTIKSHTGSVNDVQFHPFHESLIGSCSDDGSVRMFDIRAGGEKKSISDPTFNISLNESSVNCLQYSPYHEFLLASGSADSTVAIWDMRNTKEPLHVLSGHEDEVTSLLWSPQDPSVLASSGYDRTVIIWDLSKVGTEQSAEDAEDGPPELIFMHGGHTNVISDLTWFPQRSDVKSAQTNSEEPNIPMQYTWLLASAAEDNIVQIWSPTRYIIANDDEDISTDEVE